MWYVYIDWTAESKPRPFYVGKGDLSRVNQPKRSKRHSAIVELYGVKRVVVCTTRSESRSFRVERTLISKHRTYYLKSEIGCNLTLGGQGTSGHKKSKEAKQKIREWHLGKKHPHTEETKKKISLTMKGKPPNNKGKKLSLKTRLKMSNSRKGVPKSAEWKRKRSESMMGNKIGIGNKNGKKA